MLFIINTLYNCDNSSFRILYVRFHNFFNEFLIICRIILILVRYKIMLILKYLKNGLFSLSCYSLSICFRKILRLVSSLVC
jgi:hypothetical protein